MVPLGMELVSSDRLSIQTTLVSGTIWPQFAMQVLTVDYQPPVWGKGWWSYGVGDRPLNSPGTISYRLPIVNIGLLYCHRFRSVPDVPDGLTDGIGLANGGTTYELIKSASAAKKVR